MKTLILVRHAKSAWPDISLPDYERPLETQGIEDSNQMGKYLKTKLTKPDYIITSGAKRTLETAQIISKELVKQPIALNINKSIYGASINEMENIIKNFNQKYKNIMVVGHNPTMTLLINKISNTNIDHVPELGTAIINYNINHWIDFKSPGELVEFIYPEKLKLIS
tara:strand:+ start:77 stop:577 length:501 start_codon:yes stop_codon:yes gene_type:complete